MVTFLFLGGEKASAEGREGGTEVVRFVFVGGTPLLPPPQPTHTQTHTQMWVDSF